jgi:hypothetical protein
MLSLPIFVFMPRGVQRGFVGLNRPAKSNGGVLTSSTGIHPYTMLALNLISQLICVSGVNQLSSVRYLLFFILHIRAHFPPACLPSHARTSPVPV